MGIVFVKHAPRIKNIIDGTEPGCTTRYGNRIREGLRSGVGSYGRNGHNVTGCT